MARIAFRTLMRAAAVDFITEYRATLTDTRLADMNVYRARPRSVTPPHAFVDAMTETINPDTPLLQRRPRAEVVVLFGLFDDGEAVDQADAFADGLLDWTRDRYHQANANTMIAVVDMEDIPNYVPDWLPPEKQRTYFGTRITLEGLALEG